MPQEPIPGVPADLKGKTYTELLGVFETFAKEKPGATNDEHVALGLMFLCALRDGDDALRRKFEDDVSERLAKLENFHGPIFGGPTLPPCSNGRRWHDMRGQLVCPACGWTPKAIERGGPTMAHVGHRDSLARYGTGHPSEMPCAKCGRPSWDKQTVITVAGKRCCSAACSDADVRSPFMPGEPK